MKTRKLELSEDFESLKKWLEENLSNDNSFTPHVDLIPQIEEKGIYFWFMKPSGYLALSAFVDIKAIEPRYSKMINGELFDLVYLGTTGTGKQGKSNLTKRLDWHLNQKHRESAINQEQSALSTLRTGLGALLADDLIENNTEGVLNFFLRENFKIFWIKYPDNNELINNDEEILIKTIKPLLNIKSNPNAKLNSGNNYTKDYKVRRIEIEKKTKQRLGFKNETNFIVNNRINNAPRECKFEFNGHNYELSYNDKPRLLENGFEKSGISTILKKLIDDKKLPIVYDKKTTTQQLTNRVIRLFRVNPVNEQIVTAIKFEPIDVKNTSFLISCSSTKLEDIDLENRPFLWSNLAFANELTEYRKEIFALVENANSHQRKKNGILIDVTKEIDLTKTIPAHKLYSPGKLFGAAKSINWCDKKNEKVYIISALFGIIRADNYIPNYNFALGDLINNVETIYWRNKLDTIIKKLLGDDCQIISLLSNNYSNILNHTILNQLTYPNINWSDKHGHYKGVWLKDQLDKVIC